jgi:glycosyltransferase involved in cell wall biosynthesis
VRVIEDGTPDGAAEAAYPWGPDRVRFSVIVPAYNAAHYLRRTLPAIAVAAERFGDAEIILVDNGSTDATRSVATGCCPQARILKLPRGTISRARNAGAQCASGEYLVFLDADCLVDPDYLQVLEECLASSNVPVTGSSYALPERAHWIESAWHNLHRRRGSGPTRLIPGGNLIVQRTAFEEVGGFDETLITGEDHDLCERLSSTGRVPYADLRIRAVHLGNPKDLGSFFRRNVWHALGAARGTQLMRDRIFQAAVVHCLFILGGAIAVVLGLMQRSVLTLTLGMALLFALPTAAVIYRVATRGGGVSLRNGGLVFTSSLMLYSVYLVSRAWAALLILSGNAESYGK